MADQKWNSDNLFRLMQQKLDDTLFLLVSNREPYVHNLVDGKPALSRPVSGLTQALDPVMRASKGIWVAYGGGSADSETVDADDHLAVPPDDPAYTLRRVWLTEEEVNRFYLGFSNEALWPLCHISFNPPDFREEDWHIYREVNQLFAEVVLKEIDGRKAVVLVQDYHFALLPGILRQRAPELTIGQFWHIPWPPYEIFRTCPWYEEILEGMLGNDLMGFHIRAFCDNFLDSVWRTFPSGLEVNDSMVFHDNRITYVEPFPISVDFESISSESVSRNVEQEMDALKRKFNLDGKLVGMGMDRVDYTKGIPERLKALDRFFSDFPEYLGKVVFIQAGMPSRTSIGRYHDLLDRTNAMAGQINEKYGTESWQPVIMMMHQLSSYTLDALRRLSRFCAVSSLHDGMNLVAKEYVSARSDEDGVLILSRFTGAAEELKDALLINPYDTGEFARAIKQSLEMPPVERRWRMKALRAQVAENNIFRWGAEHVSRLISLSE